MSLRLFGRRGARIVIDPAAIAREVASLRAVRDELIRRGGQAAADAHLTEVLARGLNHFADSYHERFLGTLWDIAALRDRLTAVREAVARGDEVRADVVRGIMTDLEARLGALVGPAEAPRRAGELILPGEPAGRPGRVSESPVGAAVFDAAIAGRRAAFDALPPDVRAAVRAAARHDGAGLRRLVRAAAEGVEAADRAEVEARLRAAGMSAEEVAAARRGAEQLGRAVADDVRARGGIDANMDAALADAAGRVPGDRFRDAITDPAHRDYFRELAYRAPDTLVELWHQYSAKPRTISFRRYVGILRGSIYRGLAGEYHAAFAFGLDWVVLKGPDAGVTIPGTDLIVVHRRTGRILVVDNKSVAARVVAAISALERNVARNLADDAAALAAPLDPGTPPVVRGAVERIGMASADVQAYLASPPTPKDLNSAAVQARIGELVAAHDIGRGATGAGGRATAVAPRLTRRGIGMIDPDAATAAAAAEAAVAGHPRFSEPGVRNLFRAAQVVAADLVARAIEAGPGGRAAAADAVAARLRQLGRTAEEAATVRDLLAAAEPVSRPVEVVPDFDAVIDQTLAALDQMAEATGE
jgi:hypothetical protein